MVSAVLPVGGYCNESEGHSEPEAKTASTAAEVPSPALSVPVSEGGDGIVFDKAVSQSSSVSPAYEPDWSRFNKEGLFGGPAPATSVTSAETPDVLNAEAHYTELLLLDIPDVQRRKVLLDMANLYYKTNVKPKEAAVYERFIEAYPQDEMIPELYMRLGFLYRDMGLFQRSLTKFYSVLNSSLAINRSGIEVYKQLSLRAQIEIADTYYSMGDYNEASKFYMRLKRLNMPKENRVNVDFKYAYTQFLSKDYPATISSFQAFIQMYPDDPLVAEAHFVLANAYREINQSQAALNEVLSLLQYQEGRPEDSQSWLYWKKRTGNQLGNEFYEQGDYESALYIYQAMARLSDDPNWLWPALYQMGLCLERLRLTKKAVDAYDIIINGAEAAEKSGAFLPSNLSDIVDQVKWRKDHLNWVEDSQGRIQQIMGQ